jgi:hypothetical protein
VGVERVGEKRDLRRRIELAAHERRFALLVRREGDVDLGAVPAAGEGRADEVAGIERG